MQTILKKTRGNLYMKINKVSDLFNVEDKQSDLEYVNICIDGADNRLYVDGIQIAGNSDALSKRCNIIIEDFFNTIFEHLGKNEHITLKKLLDQSKENNSLRLGKSEISPGALAVGKGCSQDMLYKLFTRVINKNRNLIESGLIKKPMDTVLFIKGFGEDRMSDLIVSLIFKELIEFTNGQASNAPNKPKTEKVKGKFWNHITHNWDTFTYDQILDLQNRPLTLVPKNFVTDKYVYRVDRYISSCLVVYEKEIRLKENPNYKCPNIKSLKKELENSLGLTGTEFIITYTLNHLKDRDLVEKFRRDNEHNSKGNYRGKLTDQELTSIIEAPYMEMDDIG
ncbi:TPA: hypothetical protein PYZ05_002668 [Staphylococcus aureus]|nr:hypothetical protein [Staphylococcus aureus]